MIRRIANMLGNLVMFFVAWYFISVVMILASTGEVHWDFWGLFQ